MLKKLLIIIIVDILLLGPSMYFGDSDPSISIGLLILIPLIIAINLVVWFIFLSRQSSWAKPLLINCLIAPVILNYFFDLSIKRHVDNNFKSYYFSQNKMNYELEFDLKDGHFKDSLKFGFYELQKGSSWGIDVNGTYISMGDTVFMTSTKGKVMKVSKMILFDYPEAGDKTKLNASRE